MELQDIKDHIDEKFSNHDQLAKLRHDHFEETLVRNSKDIEKNEEAVKRVHGRVDKITTQIKTVQGVGSVLGGGIALFLAWLGLIKQ
jgi:hypothetical protein